MRLICLSITVIVSFSVLTVPDWGHLPWASKWQSVAESSIDLGGKSIIFLSNKPKLYIAASINPANSIFVDISGEFDLRANNETELVRVLKRDIAFSNSIKIKEIDNGSTVSRIVEGIVTITPNVTK